MNGVSMLTFSFQQMMNQNQLTIPKKKRFALIVAYLCKNKGKTMAGIDNLVHFEKGKSGNPNGRPKGVQNSKTRLLRLLELVQKRRNPITGEDEDFTVLELMDMQMISKALKGDQRAYEAVVDRLEGKPKQTTDITADIKGNVQITIEPDADCQPIKD